MSHSESHHASGSIARPNGPLRSTSRSSGIRESKDQFGLSWQVVPTVVEELLKDENSETTRRATEAVLRMKKIDIAELERVAARPRA